MFYADKVELDTVWSKGDRKLSHVSLVPLLSLFLPFPFPFHSFRLGGLRTRSLLEPSEALKKRGH